MELSVGILGFDFMGRTHTFGPINMPLYYDSAPFRIKHVSVSRGRCHGRERYGLDARVLTVAPAGCATELRPALAAPDPAL